MSGRGSPVDAERLGAWVAAYDRQGWHRTGSRTDAASARWLAAAAGGEGARVAEDRWPLTRLVVRRAGLALSDAALPGVPLFDARLPPTGLVEGTLSPLGGPGAIGVCDLAERGAGARLRAARGQARHDAIVCLSAAADGDLRLLNAPDARRPHGPPVLQLAGAHRRRLARALEAGERATFRLVADRRPATALNVVATAGDNRARRPAVAVLTPRSGWWHCAAERGGGLACWLATLAAVPGDPGAAGAAGGVRFLATSGHELGFLGLDVALGDDDLPPDAAWLHLGANLGARRGTVRLWASEPRLGALTLGAFARVGLPLPAALERPVGEAAGLHRRGRPCVSLVATNERFHSRRDRYPDNVDLEQLARIADAVRLIVDALVAV